MGFLITRNLHWGPVYGSSSAGSWRVLAALNSSEDSSEDNGCVEVASARRPLAPKAVHIKGFAKVPATLGPHHRTRRPARATGTGKSL